MKNTKTIPGITLEAELSQQIYNSLQGGTVEAVLKIAKTSPQNNYWKDTLEGHSFKVDAKLLGRLHSLFYQVKDDLGFTENVDFYITGDASVNAFAVSAQEEGEPHIVNVNSALVQLMSDDELRFVIGHELGHLMNRDADLLKLIHFVFPEGSNVPITLQYKIRLWNQLAELVADRYGFEAMPNLAVCVSAFFKMSSGLDFQKMDMQIDAFIEENNKRLEYFMKEGLNMASHPVNPIRVQALNLYAQQLDSETLNEQMDKLIDVLLKVRSSELDYDVARFIATAGLIMANCDNEVDDDEINVILQSLSEFQMFPKLFLDQIVKGEKVVDTFNEAVGNILEKDPGQREGMFRYLITLVMADKEFNPEEVKLLFTLGQKMFGYSGKEIAQLFAQMVQANFLPSFEALC